MRNCALSRLLAISLTFALGGGVLSAQSPAPRANEKEKVPAVIPAPKAEPVVPPSPAKSIAAQLNDAFVSVFERVAPAVVIIDVTKKPLSEPEANDDFRDFFFRQGPDGSGGDTAPDRRGSKPPTSEGSGFIIQSSGYILTNNHVVKGADRISVKLKDGRQFPAKLAGSDERTDIAVIKIEATDLPVEELADSDSVRVGELACAIGVPYNLDYTFTTGVVSAKGRNRLELGGNGENYEDYIQTDASINPGNSGGPLVNLDGKVIGMNTLINGLNRGLGFAIPSNMLREVGDQLIHNGHVIRPYIGVLIVSVDEDTPEKYGNIFNAVKKGVIVVTIKADSPAFKSDLRPEDVITEVDGIAVGTDRELQKQILSKKVGATVQLTVFRRGKTLKIAVITGELPSDPGRASANPGDKDGNEQRPETGQFYGMQLQELTRDLATNLGVTATNGVVVTSVADDSPAARASVTAKDVITAVDDRPVKDVPSFKEAIKNGDPKRGIVCYLERPTGKSFVVIKAD